MKKCLISRNGQKLVEIERTRVQSRAPKTHTPTPLLDFATFGARNWIRVHPISTSFDRFGSFFRFFFFFFFHYQAPCCLNSGQGDDFKK